MHLRVFPRLAWGLAMILVAGCSVGAAEKVPTLQVITSNMKFETQEITVKTGQPVKLVLVNKDVFIHDITIDRLPGKFEEQTGDLRTHDPKRIPDLHVSALPGKTSSIEFTPTEGGSYDFYCAVAGHKEAGMIGRLNVR